MGKDKPDKFIFSIVVWYAAAFLIVVLSFIFLVYSSDLTYWAKPLLSKVLTFTLLEIFAGTVFVLSFVVGSKILNDKKIIWLIILSGFAARIILIPSQPVLEDDYNRYIWDGAVVANGINPYKYSPLEIGKDSTSSKIEIQTLHKLSREADKIFTRINYPEVRTIYPVISQIFFAVSYIISGWTLLGWRIISLLADIVTLMLLLVILKKLKLPFGLSAIYWLNPVVLTQFFNAGHMDVLIFPFILGSVWFLLNHWENVSSFFLALAAAVKVWPIVLFPIMYRNYFKQKLKIIVLLSIPIVVLSILYTPVLLTKLDNSLGFVRYAGNWYNNDAVFWLVSLSVNFVHSLFSSQIICAHCIARYIVFGLYMIFMVFIIWKPVENNPDLLERILLSVTVLFFLSPTEFPWYYTWILPFLVFRPRLSLLLYPILLPLYELQNLWQNVVWFEHIPIIILFVYELRNKDKFNLFKFNLNVSLGKK